MGNEGGGGSAAASHPEILVHTADLSLPSTSSGPSGGKRKYSAITEDEPISSTTSLSQPPSSNSMRGTRASTSKQPTRATHTTVLNNMQGSINQLSDVFKLSLTSPHPSLTLDNQAKAMMLLRTVDDGLSMEDKVRLIKLFEKDGSLVASYLNLENDQPLRKIWIQQSLAGGGN
jgi:hypothetical protein